VRAVALLALTACLCLALPGSALAAPGGNGGKGGKGAKTAFRWRGVIQGAYGPIFSHPQRVALLEFMHKHGFNAYINAPKDDPYQRSAWRVPYPADQQAELDSEVQLATQLGIQWIPNISPAQPLFSSNSTPGGTTQSPPICYSCPEDLEALLAKYQPFAAAGARTFMLSTDDATQELTYPQDIATYGQGPYAFGVANADLFNRVAGALQARVPGAHLLTVGPEYLGNYDRPFLQGLRSRLAPGIDVMWTGPDIQARQFRAADADRYASILGRRTILFENWTANDQTPSFDGIPGRVYLGPYRRVPSLVGHLKGFFLDASQEVFGNFLPFTTAAKYMNAPRRYRPRESFLAATRELGGPQAESLRAFAETSYSDTLAPTEEAPTFRHLAASMLDGYRRLSALPDPQHPRPRLRAKRAAAAAVLSERAAALDQELRLVIHARGKLLQVKRLRGFVGQLKVFFISARLGARTGLLATALLEADGPRRRQALRRRLQDSVKRSLQDPYETYGSREHYFFLIGNVMDRYVERVQQIDHSRARHGR